MASAVVGAFAAACAPDAALPPVKPAPLYEQKAHAPGPMGGIRATRMADALAGCGLDVRDLPPIEQLSLAQKQKVMRTFSETLGVPCLGCHAEDDFTADTRRKRIAKRMYNEIVRVLTLRDGEPVYCDSCHDGTLDMLDHRDTAQVTRHMSVNLVGQMARIDGRQHDCDTCHGDPPDFRLMTTWKRSPAPDILPFATPQHGEIIPPYLPTPGARVPVDCGPMSEQCPLQGLMRADVSNTTAASDGPGLARALEQVAAYSPDPAWSWRTIARDGADAARKGDFDAARKSCPECHALYKVTWRAQHRTRADH